MSELRKRLLDDCYCDEVSGTCMPCRAADALDAQAAEIARLRDDVSLAIGSNRYLDPPDGGNVPLPEQVRRMRVECDALRAELDRIKAQASDATEYVLAQINKELRLCIGSQAHEIAQLTACRDELREATIAIDDPAINNLTTLPEAIRALRARVEAAERDAERYRWLREPARSIVSGEETSRLMLHALHGGKFRSNLDALDAEIDAARGGA